MLSESKLELFDQAVNRVKPWIRQTPIIDEYINQQRICLKLENLQITGAFKVRGAINAVMQLPESVNHIVTASAGNHGKGLAYAAQTKGIRASVFVPKKTSEEKIMTLNSYQAKIYKIGECWDDALAAAEEFALKQSLPIVHPFADLNVIAGQATLLPELLSAESNLDAVLVAVGGGGLLAGISQYARFLNPNLKIIGVEPNNADTLFQSLAQNKIIQLSSVNTIASSLAVRKSSELNLNLIKKTSPEILRVSEESIKIAANRLWLKFGLALEYSAAVAYAALFEHQASLENYSRIAVLICGSGQDNIRSQKKESLEYGLRV